MVIDIAVQPLMTCSSISYIWISRLVRVAGTCHVSWLVRVACLVGLYVSRLFQDATAKATILLHIFSLGECMLRDGLRNVMISSSATTSSSIVD
jgi:hypothetical protein